MSKTKQAHSHAPKDAANRQSDGEQRQEEMCCDGSGRTAEEHRKESADGKCCVDK